MCLELFGIEREDVRVHVVVGDARIRTRGSESSSTERTSSSGLAGWIGTHTAPIAAVAKSEPSATGWFCPWNATRSPRPTPFRCSSSAMARASFARSR